MIMLDELKKTMRGDGEWSTDQRLINRVYGKPDMLCATFSVNAKGRGANRTYTCEVVCRLIIDELFFQWIIDEHYAYKKETEAWIAKWQATLFAWYTKAKAAGLLTEKGGE